MQADDTSRQVGSKKFMQLALKLAAKGRGGVEPNPMVGAVLVRDGKIIGKGYHQRFGQGHAEVNALTDAKKNGNKTAGADLYVTLEPCSHWGKTPPCANALVEAGIKRVFCAMEDPFEKVAGKGFAILQKAGVETHVGLLQSEARNLNQPFLKRIFKKMVWVQLKWAQSVDGKIAAASGDSKWISSEASRKLVHQWRAQVDAIMVGIGTVLQDDPLLTARDVSLKRQARRVVIDPHLKLPFDSRLLTQGKKCDGSLIPLLVAVSSTALKEQQGKAQKLREMGVELFELPVLSSLNSIHAGATAGSLANNTTSTTALNKQLGLSPLLAYLSDKYQATNVLVEGGGKLHGSLIAQGLVDQLSIFVSPKIVGDANAPAGITGLYCPTMDKSLPVRLQSTKVVGQDILLDYRVSAEY